MKNIPLLAFGILAAILIGAYFWASPEGSWTGVIWLMIAIALGSLAAGLMFQGGGMSKVMTLTVGFMFYIGSIFVMMKARDVREGSDRMGEIITAYPETVATNVIPFHRKGMLNRWQIKTDRSIASIVEFYTDPANLGDWKVKRKTSEFVQLSRPGEALSIKVTRDTWTYAEFRHSESN